MARLISGAHTMGYIVERGIKCEHCTQRRAIKYGTGVLFCWNCKNKEAV